MKLKVTVCEFRDDPPGLAEDWQGLVAHVKAQASDLVLLPEMPFYPWFARTRAFDPAVWQAAVDAHAAWQKRFAELAPALVLGSQPVGAASEGMLPVNRHSQRWNEAFIWEQRSGYRPAHSKYYLPDDEGFWEASWYQRGDGAFTPSEIGALRVGFLLCTELWFMQHARAYGQAGVHIVASPRATGKLTLDKWLAGGRASAVVAGAFSLSSNRTAPEDDPSDFGGQGWVIGPDGQVLGLTSRQQPFVTVEIDLAEAEQAKSTYPRYVLD